VANQQFFTEMKIRYFTLKSVVATDFYFGLSPQHAHFQEIY